MFYIFGKTTVEDYNRWKTVFSENADRRRSNGVVNVLVLHSRTTNPNNLNILFEMKDENSMNNFYDMLHTDTLKELFKKSGVVGDMPDFEKYDDTQKMQ